MAPVGSSIAVTLASWQEGAFPFVYLLLSAHHTGAYVSTIFSLFFLASILRKDSASYRIHLSLALLIVVSLISDRLYGVIFLLPSMAIPGMKLSSRRNRIALALVLFSTLVGFFSLHSLHHPSLYYVRNFSPSADLISGLTQESRKTLGHALANSITTFLSGKNYNVALFLFSILLPSFISLVWIVLRAHRSQDKDQFQQSLLITLPWIVSLTLPVLMAIFTLRLGKGFLDTRYMTSIFFFPLFLMGIPIASLLQKANDISHLIVSAAIILFAAALIWLLPFSGMRTFSGYAPSVATCVDRMNQVYGLKYGFSDYWSARPGSLYSRQEVRINQLKQDLTPYFWINNRAIYKEALKQGGHIFLIASGFDSHTIEKKWGKPDHVQHCGDYAISIYQTIPEYLKLAIESN